MIFELKKTNIECPKCGSKTTEIYYYFGTIRNKCDNCGYIFNKIADLRSGDNS